IVHDILLVYVINGSLSSGIQSHEVINGATVFGDGSGLQAQGHEIGFVLVGAGTNVSAFFGHWFWFWRIQRQKTLLNAGEVLFNLGELGVSCHWVFSKQLNLRFPFSG